MVPLINIDKYKNHKCRGGNPIFKRKAATTSLGLSSKKTIDKKTKYLCTTRYFKATNTCNIVANNQDNSSKNKTINIIFASPEDKNKINTYNLIIRTI
jgi:hypothetical protein